MITNITSYEVAAILRPEELWEIMVRINRLGEVDGWYSIDSNQGELLTTQAASFLRTPSLPAYVFADSGIGYG